MSVADIMVLKPIGEQPIIAIHRVSNALSIKEREELLGSRLAARRMSGSQRALILFQPVTHGLDLQMCYFVGSSGMFETSKVIINVVCDFYLHFALESLTG